MKLTWKIGGEAGFGIMTTGLVFSKIVNRLGYHSFDYIEYPSLIRGGHNAIECVVSDEEIKSLKKEVDYLVCLNEDTFRNHRHRLVSQSIVVYDPDEFTIEETAFGKVSVPFKKILSELKGQVVMKNTIAIASTLALFGADIGILYEILEQQFAKKGREVVDYNREFAKRGFTLVKNQFPQFCKAHLPKMSGDARFVMSGNDAFALGASIGDCRMYCAYPMTPSSTVLTTLAAWQQKSGMVVRHAEDEISVINTALGASFMGARSAVGTSGGGFALMVESVSFAGIAEIPIVVFVSQRPGPATGMPTWTAQGDLLFAVHAGHGEFPKIILAPGDVEEMVAQTAKAFNLADIYQTPVIVMSDMYLSESHQTLTKQQLDVITKAYTVDRGKTVDTPTVTPYLRYKVTDDGISERLIPGAKGFYYQDNSYEHVEDGHTTEEAAPRKAQHEKRLRKVGTYLKKHFEGPKVLGDIDSAGTVFVSWGSNKGPIMEAQRMLSKENIPTAFLHFTHLFPLDPQKIVPHFRKDKRYVLIEANGEGQFGKLLKAETGIEIRERFLKYDGRCFFPEEIVEFVKTKEN